MRDEREARKRERNRDEDVWEGAPRISWPVSGEPFLESLLWHMAFIRGFRWTFCHKFSVMS